MVATTTATSSVRNCERASEQSRRAVAGVARVAGVAGVAVTWRSTSLFLAAGREPWKVAALTPRACDFGRVDRHEAFGDGVGVGLRRFALRFCRLVDDLRLLQRLDCAIAEIHADERVRRTAKKRGYGAAASSAWSRARPQLSAPLPSRLPFSVRRWRRRRPLGYAVPHGLCRLSEGLGCSCASQPACRLEGPQPPLERAFRS